MSWQAYSLRAGLLKPRVERERCYLLLRKQHIANGKSGIRSNLHFQGIHRQGLDWACTSKGPTSAIYFQIIIGLIPARLVLICRLGMRDLDIERPFPKGRMD